jgi:hypothetical protein
MNKQYRFQTGTLFEYNEEQNAYVACFTDYRANTKAKAIKAYELSKQNQEHYNYE